jgi:hypothetical protein
MAAAALAASAQPAPAVRTEAPTAIPLPTPRAAREEAARPSYMLPINRRGAESAQPSALPSARGSSASATPRSSSVASSVPSNGSLGPRTHTRDVQRARQREALQKLLGSSAQALGKFEQTLETLRRGASESNARYQALEVQLTRASGAGGPVLRQVQAQLEQALTVSTHTTADMEAAVARAEYAVDYHRAAHDALAARDSHDSDLTASPPSRLPSHPTEPSNVLQETTTLREAQAECRKVLRASEQAFTAARAEMANAASKVQAAIGESRKQAKISVERERARGPVL